MRKILRVSGFLSALVFGGAGIASADSFTVYTYGGGQFLTAVFEGLSMFFYLGGGLSDVLYDLLKLGIIAVLLAGVLKIFMELGSRNQEGGTEPITHLIKTAIVGAFAIYMIALPKATVIIQDEADPANSNVVANVPLVTAITASFTSTLGKAVGDEFATVFNVSIESPAENAGAVSLGLRYMNMLTRIYPPDSSSEGLGSSDHLITQSLREFFQRCVFPNFSSLDGEAGMKTLALDELSTSTSLLATIRANSLYRDVNTFIIAPTTSGYADCGTAIDAVYGKWTSSTVKNAWITDQERRLLSNPGLTGQEDPMVPGHFSSAVFSAYFGSLDYATGMMNLAVANLMRDSLQQYLAMTGTPSYTASTLASRTTSSGWRQTAQFFGSLVNTMRLVFEGLAYGLSAFLPLAFVFTSFKAIGGFAKILLWLQLWIPFYVILNAFADMQFANSMSLICKTLPLGGGDCLPTLKTIDLISNRADISLAYVGGLAPLVPSLAWGILKGGEYAMSHAMGMVTAGGWVSGISRTGGEVEAKGNLNMANRSFGSDNYGSSSVVTSQMGFTGSMVHGREQMAGLRQMSHATGGNYSSIAEGSGQLKAMQSMGGMTGFYRSFNALKDARMIPANWDPQDFASAQQSHGKVSTPEGDLSYAVSDSGDMTWTSSTSGHSISIAGSRENPAMKFMGTALGNVSPMLESRTIRMAEQNLQEAHKKSEGARESLNNSLQGTWGKANEFSDAMKHSDIFQSGEGLQIKQAVDNARQELDEHSKSEGYAGNYGEKSTGSAGVGIDWKILQFGGKEEVYRGTQRNATEDDKRSENALKKWQDSIGIATDFAAKHGDDFTKTRGEKVSTALQDTATKAKEYSTAYAHEQAASETFKSASQEGSKIQQKLDPVVLGKAIEQYDVPGATNLIRDLNTQRNTERYRQASEKMAPIIDETINEFLTGETNKRVSEKLADSGSFGSDVEGHISNTQRGLSSPESNYKPGRLESAGTGAVKNKVEGALADSKSTQEEAKTKANQNFRHHYTID